ncbi:hypothetical protein BO78DRAFT_164176 [Aspergillus sclerotiicarbonarius CBS 121057]|uniref:Uncharacterized protein n=1 Tax=Aspergillus sclerotiicarbonarius (strain CBS 121057 / IBT 28362) TaxID=1448318 RepID=A0A319EUB1_ASPSB|nr:hypothetical protein BO78DRAFT_164176 [Aspergillus sclerotiicarbonarius CBS 121057]
MQRGLAKPRWLIHSGWMEGWSHADCMHGCISLGSWKTVLVGRHQTRRVDSSVMNNHPCSLSSVLMETLGDSTSNAFADPHHPVVKITRLSDIILMPNPAIPATSGSAFSWQEHRPENSRLLVGWRPSMRVGFRLVRFLKYPNRAFSLSGRILTDNVRATERVQIN